MGPRGPLVALAHRLASSAAAIVPRAHRADFRAEWAAEIEWAAAEIAARRGGTRRLSIELLRRSCGAFPHALALRREQWSLDMLWQDLKYAARVLAARPLFTLVAVLTIALGIGANTAIFSVVYGVLLKPLPFRHPDRLVLLWETNPLRGWTQATASPANLLDWKRRNRVFEDIAFYPGMEDKSPMYVNGTLTREGAEPDRVRGARVSVNFFDVLGVRPQLGRSFTLDEQRVGQHRVAILSDGFWRAQFQGNPDIVGRDITINTLPYKVIGVAPRGLRFPAGDIQMWVPFAMSEGIEQARRPHWLRPVARLKPGVTIEQARDDLTRIAADLEREYPDTNRQMGVGLAPLHEWVVGDVRRPLLTFLGAVALVLLVACANLANLLLARAAGRQRELAIRSALGGAGWRIARQVLTESAVLACAGGLLGVLVARWALAAIVGLSPDGIPRLEEAAIDVRMLIFVAALTSLAALLFGLLPAWQSARVEAAWLRRGTRATGGIGRTRRLLVVAQVAASVALVAGAGLLLRSFERLQAVPPGFDPEGVLTFRVDLPGARYDTDEKMVRFFEDLLARLRRLPGVTAAGGSTVLGLEGQGWTGDLFIEGRPDVHGRELRHKDVTAGYFKAVGLSILRGRDLQDSDTVEAPPVVVVNQALVRAYFGRDDPVGARVSFSPDRSRPRWHTIVGVVQDEKQNSLAEPVQPGVYGSHRQNPTDGMAVALRATVPPTMLAGAARAELRALDAALAPYDVRTLREVVGSSLARERFTTWIVGLFAALALTIAAVGVYGVVMYSVTGRTQEIGVRVALGATRRQVTGLVLRETFGLVAAGLLLGIALSLATSRAMQTLLFETRPTDPLTYASVVAVLGMVGVLAAWVPVRRALRVEAATALRYE